MFLGISVVLFGLIAGEYLGASVDKFYTSTWWEFALIFGFAFYCWSKPTGGLERTNFDIHMFLVYDDTKIRMILFARLLFLGALIGHVFPLRIMNTVPANMACLPFTLAFLVCHFRILQRLFSLIRS